MTTTEGPIPVPADVLGGLEAIRRSGLTNMLDRPRVIELAIIWGYDATARWVIEHPGPYSRGIFRGFVAKEE